MFDAADDILSTADQSVPATSLDGLRLGRAGEIAALAAAVNTALATIERARPALDTDCELRRARVELCLVEANARSGMGDSRGSRLLYQQALALARGLGDAELLARVELAGGRARTEASSARAKPPTFELSREGDFWTITSAEGVLRLKHSRGLETLHFLLTHPDQEFHVRDLAGTAGSGPRGDAGPLLDQQARNAYRRRLEGLREELSEAEAFGDSKRAERARSEIDFLAAELSRAVGIGGRARRAGDPSERARVTVQKRVKQAIRKIEQGSPRLARFLSLTVHTGSFCAYRPDVPNLTLFLRCSRLPLEPPKEACDEPEHCTCPGDGRPVRLHERAR